MELFSAPYSYEAIPFVKAIQEQPTVQFEWLPWKRLVEAFTQRRIEAVLTPPTYIGDFQDVFIIPGVGITFEGVIPSPRLFSRVTSDEIKSIAIDPRYEYWAKWIEFIFRLTHQKRLEIAIGPVEMINQPDAVLTDFNFPNRLGVIYTYQYDLWELWRAITDFPLVSWVWLCRADKDYRRIRSTVGRLWHRACELLESYQSGNCIDDESLERDRITLGNLSSVYYRLASLESDSLHWLISKMKEVGLAESTADIRYC